MNFTGIIDGVNFSELEAEKYWTPPKTKTPKECKEMAKNFIFSGDYLGAVKKDGAYYRFIKDENGEMHLQGRSRSVNGNFLDKIDHVPHLNPFFEWLPNGTCLLGEIYFPDWEGSHNVTTIMGCLTEKAIQRQNDINGKGKLDYYVFDIWAYAGKSLLKTSFIQRVECLKEISELKRKKALVETSFSYIEFAEYFSGKELWETLQTTLANGGEGVVITKFDSIPAPGKRTARKTLKIKKEIAETLDVFVMGANPPTKEYSGKYLEEWKYWYNEKTGEKLEGIYFSEYMTRGTIIPVTKNFFYNWAGSLKLGVMKNDKPYQVGNLSGLTEEILSGWTKYIGKVMEITCMEVYQDENGDGGFRHPKFVQWRNDLTTADATYEKIYGK